MITTFFMIAFLLLFGGLAVTSLRERQIRAFWVCTGFAGLCTLFWGAVLPALGPDVTVAAAAAVSGGILVSSLPFFPQKNTPRDLSAMQSSVLQYDERDTMFARNQISRFPELMAAYYTTRPENRSVDYLEKTIPLSDGPPAPEKQTADPQKLADTITDMVRFYISRNILNQTIALFMDDLLYGRKKSLPKSNPDRLFHS